MGSEANTAGPSSGARIGLLTEKTAPDELGGERKTVTALFADIKGSMELMEDLDPEEARAIVDPALKLMIDAANHYGGYIIQSTGDGIFALFGAPLAHEDHPQRALYAALRMHQDIRRFAERLRAEKGLNLQVRVGANVGDVVVRSIQTGESQVEYTPIGHSISLASRLQTLANPGSIAISEVMRRLVDGYFTLEPLGPALIRGSSEPVNVYEVLGLGPLRTRLQRAAARGLTKFVGRQREMEALEHAAERARSEHGQIVAVIAEPGVGKSRLFYEFKVTSQSGWMVLEAYSVSHGKASAYLPVLELLSAYFEINRNDDDRRRRERILGKVLGLDRNLEDTLPYLYSLHGIAESGDALAQLEPQIKRRRTLDAIKRILLRESLNHPLMIIFEDLHWIDSETQALLNLLVEAIANARILLLVNYRPEYRHEWGSRTHYTQLRLDPLGGESAEEMLNALMGDEDHLIPLKRLIIESTDGTPFFMEEMVHSLFEEGILQRNGLVKLAQPISAIKVPATVQAVLVSRIDRLPPAEKELLQTLAVLGREFSLTVAQRVTLKPSDVLEVMLSQLQLGEFINEQPAVGEVEYSFKHALTQEVAYNSVLIGRRKALHERTGEALEALFADRVEDYVTDLAHHYDRSGNLSKAIEYLGRVGQKTADQAAHSEAIGYVTRALELVQRLPNDTVRARYELELQITLSVCLLGSGRVGSLEHQNALARALELCEQLGDRRVMELMLSLGIARWAHREPLLGMLLCEKALALAEQARDTDVRAAAHAGLGYQLITLGQFEKARGHFEDGTELLGERPTRKFDQVLVSAQSALSGLGLTLLFLGYPITGLKRNEYALDRARRRPEPYMSAAPLGVYLMAHLALRDLATVADRVEELAAISAEHGIAFYHALAMFFRAWLRVEGGRLNEGLGEMGRIITQLGAVPPVDQLVVALVEVCSRNGLPKEGFATINDALSKSEIPFLQAEFDRLKGELTLLKDPHSEEPERYLRQAIDIARHQAARLFELRATTSLARLLAKKDRQYEALMMLAQIYNWFTEGFDLPDLKEAKALLDELGT
jgi:class 3 adenylate cyclase